MMWNVGLHAAPREPDHVIPWVHRPRPKGNLVAESLIHQVADRLDPKLASRGSCIRGTRS